MADDPTPLATDAAPSDLATDAVTQGEEPTPAGGSTDSADRVEAAAASTVSPPVTPEISVNGSSKQPNFPSNKTALPNGGGVRSASSKIANLRAAFEQGSSANGASDGLKRRLTSGEKNRERNRERSESHKLEYETEISKLKEDIEKEKQLRVAFEEQVATLEEGIEVLNDQLAERDVALREQYEHRRTEDRLEAANRLSAVEIEARGFQDEVSSLRQQLADLKRSVSTSTRATAQVSDTTLRQEIETLQHELQNFVVQNYRRAKPEASPDQLCDKLRKVTEPGQLELLRPVYQAFDAAVKLPIYQATVAVYLMEIFEDPFLFGLRGQREWAKRVKQAAECLPVVLEPSAYNRWRATTFDAIRQSASISEPVECAATGIAEMICITLQALTEVEESEARLTSLKAIVKRAISLAHLVRVQEARYEVVLPLPGQKFDPDVMDDIFDGNDASVNRAVRCAVFPSVVKVGGEEGDQSGVRNVVVKAKTLCNEPLPS